MDEVGINYAVPLVLDQMGDFVGSKHLDAETFDLILNMWYLI